MSREGIEFLWPEDCGTLYFWTSGHSYISGSTCSFRTFALTYQEVGLHSLPLILGRVVSTLTNREWQKSCQP